MIIKKNIRDTERKKLTLVNYVITQDWMNLENLINYNNIKEQFCTKNLSLGNYLGILCISCFELGGESVEQRNQII